MDANGKTKTIAETLKAEISGGNFPPGLPLPSIVRLMRRFGVARATMVAALKSLERDGLVRSRHGSGTFPVVRTATTFGVIVPDAGSPLCSRICAGVANCAKTASFGGGGATYRCSGRTRRSRSPSRTSASRPAWRARSSCGRRTPG